MQIVKNTNVKPEFLLVDDNELLIASHDSIDQLIEIGKEMGLVVKEVNISFAGVK